MNYCTTCGAALSNDDKFCGQCGKPNPSQASEITPTPSESPPALDEVTGDGAPNPSVLKKQIRLWPWVVGLVVVVFVAAGIAAVRTSGSSSSSYVPNTSAANPPLIGDTCDSAAQKAIQAVESQGVNDLLILDIVGIKELRSDPDRVSNGLVLLCSGKAIVSGGSDRMVQFGVRIQGGEPYVFVEEP